uniref:Homeobox domain-containing protein n=1 Tax=Meloidogyne hapla TaxID=6305 RepID=A0A1I8BXP3_MELHA
MSGPGPNNEIDKDEIIRQQNELIRELRQQVAFFREALFTEPIELTSLEENLEEVIPGGSGIQSTVQDNGNTDENPPSSTMPLFSNNSVSTQQSCGNTRLYGLPFAGHETYPAHSVILSEQAAQPRQNYGNESGEVNVTPSAMPLFNINTTNTITNWATHQSSGTSATTAICDDYILFNNRLYTNNSGQISFDGHGAYTGQSMISAGQLAQPRQSTGAGNASNNNTTWTQQSSCASATTRAGSGCYDLCNIGLHGNSGKRPFPGNYGYYPGQSITSGGPSQGSHPRQNYGTGSGGESGGSGAPPLKKKTKIDNKSGDSAGCSNMYEYNNIVLKPIEMQLPNNQGTKINSGNQSIQQKQKRTKLSDEQLMILRQNLDINNAPTAEQIKQIAQQTHLTENRIKNWYRNTLFKLRHYDDEEDEQ